MAELLLPEGASLDPRTLASLLVHRSSYTTRDLIVLGWDAALVVEPDLADRDVEQLLEFATSNCSSCGSKSRASSPAHTARC